MAEKLKDNVRYLNICRDSLNDEEEIEETEELNQYYENNLKGPLPYQA